MREGVSFHSSSTWPAIGVSSPPDYRRVLRGSLSLVAGSALLPAFRQREAMRSVDERAPTLRSPGAARRLPMEAGRQRGAPRPRPVRRQRDLEMPSGQVSLAASSAWVGIRLLSMPRRGANECQGNTFHRTNSLPRIPWRSSVLQTMLAVGSEKPRGALSNLLVRRGLIAEKTSFGGTSEFPPKRIRSEVMAMPVKCPPR